MCLFRRDSVRQLYLHIVDSGVVFYAAVRQACISRVGWGMWVSWSVMWFNAADAAADDVCAVALPGFSPHWESLPHLFTRLICPTAQHRPAQTSRNMHELHSSTLHANNLAIPRWLAEFVVYCSSSHCYMWECFWDLMHTFHVSASNLC